VYPRDHGAVESGTPSGAGRWASSPPPRGLPLAGPPGRGRCEDFSPPTQIKKKGQVRSGQVRSEYWVGVILWGLFGPHYEDFGEIGSISF